MRNSKFRIFILNLKRSFRKVNISINIQLKYILRKLKIK